jgi:hypothetical protein
MNLKIYNLLIYKRYKMSDDGNQDEFEYEWPSDDGGQEGEDENEILLKNTFYEADENKKTRPKEALEQYENVVLLEE